MALVPFPGQPGKPSPHDLDPDPGYRTEGNRILRRDPGADGDRDDDDADDGEAKMSFLEHLDELRKRIIYSAVSIFVGFLIAFDLYIKMILAFGLVFQMPTIVLFLAKMGVVTARFLWRHTKYAILIIVIVSAIVTPDGGGVSLVAMSIPLVFLYLFSIVLAWIFGKKRDKDIEADEQEA